MDLSLWIFIGTATIGLISYAAKVYIEHKINNEIKLTTNKKLEEVRAEFSSKLENIKHEYQLNQIRTSLFFDHQRIAYSEILACISNVISEWHRLAFDDETNCIGALPSELYDGYNQVLHKHQLFLDSDCIMAMNIFGESLMQALPPEGSPYDDYYDSEFERIKYIQPRIINIFQGKLGLRTSGHSLEEIALLGSVLIINTMHFPEINVPEKGLLKIEYSDRSADMVKRAEENRPELIVKLKLLEEYLKKKNGHFYEVRENVQKYIFVLDYSKGF